MLNEEEIKEESKFFKPLSWFMVLVFTMASMYLVNFNSTFLQTSLFQDKAHKPFDGTVLPVQKAPDWTHLTEAERKMNFDELNSLGKIVDIPFYNPDDLAVPITSLEYGDPAQDLIRNAIITYPVPYMGNYELDGLENVGSHLAVDVKLPQNTPIYAMANGIVDKVSLQSSGFGKHVVIRHNNVPTLNDPNATETLYSSYAHMKDITVNEGMVVDKGQQIGLSGNTGTATTPVAGCRGTSRANRIRRSPSPGCTGCFATSGPTRACPRVSMRRCS